MTYWNSDHRQESATQSWRYGFIAWLDGIRKYEQSFHHDLERLARTSPHLLDDIGVSYPQPDRLEEGPGNTRLPFLRG